MIRVAIVEDEAAVRDQLMGYVQRYMRQYDAQIEVTMFTDGVEILEEYRPVYDIIFLDVEMQHLDGMETASRIRALDSDVLLIFITNMAQYAIKGYAVGRILPSRSNCKRPLASWPGGRGGIWPCRWTVVCGGWMKHRSITSRARATASIFTPRTVISPLPAH